MNFEIRQSANTATVNTQSFFPFFSWWNPLFEGFFSSWEECVIYYVKVLTTTGEDQCKNLNPPPCAEIMSGEINLHLELFLPPGVATPAWLTHFWDLEENFLAPKTTPRSNPCAVFRRRRGSSLISLPSGWQFFPLDVVCHLGKKSETSLVRTLGIEKKTTTLFPTNGSTVLVGRTNRGRTDSTVAKSRCLRGHFFFFLSRGTVFSFEPPPKRNLSSPEGNVYFQGSSVPHGHRDRTHTLVFFHLAPRKFSTN